MAIENKGGIRLNTANALKKLALPALRQPGGCFADNCHWVDGIGPRDRRPMRHNLWWRQPETHQFGTAEFMRLCRMIVCAPRCSLTAVYHLGRNDADGKSNTGISFRF